MGFRKAFLFNLLILLFPSLEARKIYVSSELGNDHNEGSSLKDALKSIQYAASVSQPDDTILIAGGNYRSNSKNLINIIHSGTKDKWITFKNLDSNRPVLFVSNEAAISINYASYIQIEGLEITIDPEFITKNKNPEMLNNLTSKGNGIQIERSRDPAYLSHHIKIKSNYIHDCPGNGIDIFSADYIEISYNQIQANGNFSISSNCGIRMQFLTAFDYEVKDHISIISNLISNHRPSGTLAKVNNSCEENYGASGIVIRNNRFDQLQALKVAYVLPIRIANNVIYLNGGQAIDIFETNAIQIINNTTYQNNQNEESLCGELQINKSKDCNVYNNIFYTRLKMNGSSVSNYESINFKNNLYGNTNIFFKGEKDLNEDPMFTRTDLHAGIFDFELRPKSPAINTGINEIIEPFDFYGSRRVVTGHVDLGAFEYTGNLPKPRDQEQARLDKRHMTVSWQLTYAQGTGQILILNSKGDFFSAKLYNNLGILINKIQDINGAKRGIEFDVSALPSGLYFVFAYSETDKVATKYFVKNQFANLLNR
ncbi:MAG: choice-of-anchor Q domain-containing protein [Saprospiraceae bacterium]